MFAYLAGVQQSADISRAAVWSSDNPAVASFSSGTLIGRTAGHANVTASYMGQAHTLPVDVVAPSANAQQFARTWSGVANVYCNDLRGSTRCDFVIAYFGGLLGTTTVTLSLYAVGGALQGTIDYGGGGFSPITGAIAGGISNDGGLVIGGETWDDEGGAKQLRDWRFTRVGNTLVGSGVVDNAWVNIYGPVWSRWTFREITLR